MSKKATKKTIPPAVPPAASGKMAATILPEQAGLITFSFKHLDITHPKFKPSSGQQNYIDKLLERLRDVSCFTACQLKENKSTSLRAHAITWLKTSEPRGFNHLGPQLKDHQPFQFEVSKSKHGRVHGVFIDNVFFVIWVDPKHMLYS